MLNKPDNQYNVVMNTTVDYCKMIDKKGGSRFIQVLTDGFVRQMNRKITCPLKPGLYEFKNYKTVEFLLPPFFKPFVNTKGKLEIQFFRKDKSNLEFIALVRFNFIIADKKRKTNNNVNRKYFNCTK